MDVDVVVRQQVQSGRYLNIGTKKKLMKEKKKKKVDMHIISVSV